MKNLRRSLSIALVAALLFSIFNIIPVSADNTTYYVDSINGNDMNNGTSQSTPWRTLGKVNSITFQPGDQILFKRGCTWSGQLVLHGNGTSANPIRVDQYGTSGSKPRINGTGLGNNNMSDPAQAANIATVYLHNLDYWEIRNLEVTNGGTPDSVWRVGIMYRAEDGRTHNHISIEDCYVHDVMGIGRHDTVGGEHTYQLWNDSAGILIQVGNAATGGARTYVNDVKIRNCVSSNNYSKGIVTDDISWKGPGWVANSDGNRWYCFTNLLIENNTTNNNRGDGIQVFNGDAPLIQYNVAANNHQYTGSSYSVAMWPLITRNAVFQYNEAYGTQTNYDGQAFDLDWETKDCIIQYNYSHDNVGGMQLICCEGTKDCDNNIVRYNISQNDGSTSNQIFRLNGHSYRPQIYNNTIYVGPGRHPSIIFAEWKDGYAEGLQFKNNIIYTVETPNEWVHISDLNNNGAVYSNNLIYSESGGHAYGEPNDPAKITTNPMFVDPGSGGTGRNTVDGYKLRTGSPALNSGIQIAGSGSFDYWGNSIVGDTSPNRGAYNSAGMGGGGSDTQAPTVPTNLNASAVSSSQINLSWTASSDNVGVAGYKIYRSTTAGGTYALIKTTAGTGTTYSDSNLTPNTTYYYKVSAFDAAQNESAQSSYAYATTLGVSDTQKPTVPTNLNASAVSSSQINLSWTASTDNVGIAGYKIYRSATAGGTYALIKTTEGTGTTYSDSNLTPKTTYYYKVSAFDAAQNESAQSSYAYATTLEASASGTIGNNGAGNAGWYTISNGADYINGCKYTATSSFTVNFMKIKISGNNGDIKLAIYEDNNGVPGTKVGETEMKSSCSWNWNTFALTSPVNIQSGKTYWLCVWAKMGAYNVAYDANLTNWRQKQRNWADWPASMWSDGWSTTAAKNLCIYATTAQ